MAADEYASKATVSLFIITACSFFSTLLSQWSIYLCVGGEVKLGKQLWMEWIHLLWVLYLD